MHLVYWLLLLKAPGLGHRTFYRALNAFESPEAVVKAGAKKLLEKKIFSAETIEYLEQADPSWVAAEIDWQKQEDCAILTLADHDYPASLLAISNPPPVLFLRGNSSLLKRRCLAVVGSRNPTPGGEKNAYEFSSALAKAGFVIVSGLAIGIDGKAHQGALEVSSYTIAAFATGLDSVYPKRHHSLTHRIVKRGGLLVSELPLKTPPKAQSFPRRNRIISGLSEGVLVVEANIKSGSMITAKLAADEGREVFAIPGSIHNPLTAGTHHLIKEGAHLVESIDDIIEVLGEDKSIDISSNYKKSKKTPPKRASNLLEYIGYDAITVDELVEKTNLEPQIVVEELTLLELEERIVRDERSGGYLLLD